MFTRQHFEKVAKTIRNIYDRQRREEQAEMWSEMFEESNERFDKEKFYHACDLKYDS